MTDSKMKKQHVFILLLSVTFMSGCSLLADGDDARVVFGESIDDVVIGDDTTRVVKKLGRPDGILIGDFPGVIYEYTSGRHAGLSLGIWTAEGVRGVQAASPYEGSTSSGIGIGTARTRLHQILGQPDYTTDNTAGGWRVDQYRFEENRFVIRYSDDHTVASITMMD
jgi:hypothetical protein